MEFIAWSKSKEDQLPLLTNDNDLHLTLEALTEEPLTEIEFVDGPQVTQEPLTETEFGDGQQVTQELLTDIEIIDGPQVTEEQEAEHSEAPPLSEEELYHVFLSYSSTDSEWAESLMEELESRGLKVCCHHRDFTAGRSILDNMSECITQSQKVLLVLSPDFMNSRWCLLEANMSLFRDSLQRKVIVPVMLRSVSVPLYLAPFTYLEPQHPDFTRQLFRVLSKPNEQQQGSIVMPNQAQSLYNGKSLQPLTAVNEEELNRYSCGLWSSELPDQLRHIIQEPKHYLQAINCINKVQEKAWFSSTWVRKLFVVIAVIVSLFILGLYIDFAVALFDKTKISIVVGSILFILMSCVTFLLFWKICTFKANQATRVVRALQRAVGRANCLLFEENLLMGCVTTSKLHLVYVCLDGCKKELSPFLPFHKALLRFSSGYTCCLARRHFPFAPPPQSAHLEGGVCFCQYVLHNLNQESRFKRLWIFCREL